MSHQRNIFPFIIIFFLFLSSCYNCSLPDDNSPNNYYCQEESANDFEAYPSYITTIEGFKFNNTTKIETGFSDYSSKFRRLATSVKTIDVQNFGAKGDGSTDDTKAFQDAWNEACSSTAAVTFIVPQGKNYLLKPLRFLGPCKSDITVQTLTLYKCKNLVVKDLKFQDAQQIHVSFDKCTNVQVSRLAISAPETSPNTDGIHVTNTQNIQISSCTIGTGDDCISIVSGSQNVQVTDVTCGPGHGISIGSLGSRNSEAYVSFVVVNGVKLFGTMNGVRIKTWQGGSGSASNIKFQNVEMQNVKNPIIIDQNYCDQAKACEEKSLAVQVKNVVYQNIKGTSASNVAIDLDCSKSHPCQGIVLENVNLVREGGGKANATCNNIVNLKNVGSVSPLCP
ncbi:Polygalacturonase ADPG1 [Abeliophyllum distichum]|uniref:Polygalacturonase ADPG1 n=1 Tax=Abeliophyllum distichum TaxID=126358 RepID=A0ABD1VCK3_9LAMI